MTILVRAAKPAEAGLLAEFNAAMALETESKTLDRQRLLAGVQAVFADPRRGNYRLAESAGEALGCLLLTFEWSDWRNADFWWIQSVYVRPQARRQGVFRALYQDVEVSARAAGACGLRLYVEGDNRRAMATYAGLGMVDAHYRMMEQVF